MESNLIAEPCPDCKKPPRRWMEKKQYNSREMAWMGCEVHGHMAGGYTFIIALQNWNRYVHAVRNKETHSEMHGRRVA